MPERSLIDRPILTSMLLLAFVLLGIVALPRLTVGLLPNVAAPGLTVITRYPGVSPEKIEELLSIPLERQLSDIAGIYKLLSVSSEGESRINLIFHHDVNVEIKMLEASEQVQRIRSSFPREVEEPGIVRFDPSNRPVFILSLHSDELDLKQLRELADRKIKLHFERISGVSEVIVGGGFEREIQLNVDPHRLAAHGLSTSLIMSAVREHNQFLPGGRLPVQGETRILTDNRFKSIAHINDLILSVPRKESIDMVPLRQLGFVRDHWRDRKNISRTNGQDRVSLYIQKAGNANTLTITEQCEKIIKSINHNPELKFVHTHVSYNQGKAIREAIQQVTQACIVGGLVAIFVLYLFLRRPRMTFLIGLTIPASVITTFFFMFLFDVAIDVMSLSGLALGAGMLIDNAIVVSEAIAYRMQQMPGQTRAAVAGAVEFVYRELIASSLTTAIVFIPLAFTAPETRLLYQSLSFTVVISLAVSLFFSLTVLPALALFLESRAPIQLDIESQHKADVGVSAKRKMGTIRRWLPGIVKKYNQLLQRLCDSSIIFLKLPARFLQGLQRTSMDDLRRLYQKSLLKLFHKPIWLLGVPVVLLALAPLFFMFIKKENAGPLDSGLIEASVDLATGTSLERTQHVLYQIEQAIQKHPGVREVNSRVEKWHATLHIKTHVEYRRANSTEDIIEELKNLTEDFDEAFVYYNMASESQGSRELNIEFYGDDISIMKKFARNVAGELPGVVQGIQQVVLRFREPREDIILRPRRYQLIQNGTSTSEIGGSLRNLLSGAVVTKYYDKEREVDIRFRGDPAMLHSPEQLRQLRLPLRAGMVALPVLTSWEHGEGETRIWRKNKRKTVMLTVKSRKRGLDELAAEISAYLDQKQFPESTIYAFGDEYRRLLEGQRQMLVAVGLSLVLIYLLLGMLFESFTQPLLILMIVPISIAAVLALISITGVSLSMSVYIGLIMLGGIGVNNAILIVSTVRDRLSLAGDLQSINEFRMLRLVVGAARERLRPILMTTITTVVGMLPMALDFSDAGSLWRPLAYTVSSGLCISLLVSLVLVPFLVFLYFRYKGRAWEPERKPPVLED